MRNYHVSKRVSRGYMYLLNLKRKLIEAEENAGEITTGEAASVLASQVRTICIGVEEMRHDADMARISDALREAERLLIKLAESKM